MRLESVPHFMGLESIPHIVGWNSFPTIDSAFHWIGINLVHSIPHFRWWNQFPTIKRLWSLTFTLSFFHQTLLNFLCLLHAWQKKRSDKNGLSVHIDLFEWSDLLGWKYVELGIVCGKIYQNCEYSWICWLIFYFKVSYIFCS